MRENIGLFKAKRIDNNEWVIGHYIPFGFDVDIHYDIVFSKGDYIFCSESHQLIGINIKTLCQFTGLLDKNGKKIFEHDIVRYEVDRGFYKKAEIVFKDCQFLCIDLSNKMVSQPAFMDYELEVIGNKFDLEVENV